MFSGLTIGFFGLSRLRLEVETATKDKNAAKILHLRKDSNLLLSTLLWGNVGVNVLLTILTDSVLTGLSAFVVSTFGITIFGEILPQAYLSRHAMRVGAMFIPVIKVYQFLLYPVAKPTAWALDRWLGKEGSHYFLEEEIVALIKSHIKALDSDVGFLEGLGAINFLTLDDIKVIEEGEPLDPDSIIELPFQRGRPVFPSDLNEADFNVVQQINKTDKKWFVIADEGRAKYVLDADGFMREFARVGSAARPMNHCHRPIIVQDSATTIGQAIRQLTVHAEHAEDDVVDYDIILYWNSEKRIITGADILGRLLRGLVKIKSVNVASR